jgi:RNA polymerase sigma-70 factor (ECF subfamily)
MNAENFKKIYYPYREKLFRVAYLFLSDNELAEDIVQETYLKLWEKRNELHDINNSEAYILLVLRNLCLNHIRWKKDKIKSSYEEDALHADSLIRKIEMQNETEIIMNLIDKLPEQQRQIMMLRHCDGYTYEEIVDMTGLEVGNIRVIISRSRKILKEQFEKVIRR